MGQSFVFDIEGNGLFKEQNDKPAATKIHCIVMQPWVGNCGVLKPWCFYGDHAEAGLHGSLQQGLSLLMTAETLIGHNINRYDLPVIEKLHGLKYTGNVVDTLAWSRALNPDRDHPFGCPYVDPVTGDRIGPHSIEAWSFRVTGGLSKIKIYDWSMLTQDMLDRCIGDVIINYQALLAMMKEAGMKV